MMIDSILKKISDKNLELKDLLLKNGDPLLINILAKFKVGGLKKNERCQVKASQFWIERLNDNTIILISIENKNIDNIVENDNKINLKKEVKNA